MYIKAGIKISAFLFGMNTYTFDKVGILQPAQIGNPQRNVFVPSWNTIFLTFRPRSYHF